MNKNIFIAIGAVILITFAGIIYLMPRYTTPEADIPTPRSRIQEGQVAMPETKYVQYSESGYDEISNQKHVLFFYANWCPTCRPADTEFESRIDEIPESIVLVRVNYNDPDTDAAEKALANQHGVTYQHTFVYLDESGEEIVRWNGGRMDQLLSKVN